MILGRVISKGAKCRTIETGVVVVKLAEINADR